MIRPIVTDTNLLSIKTKLFNTSTDAPVDEVNHLFKIINELKENALYYDQKEVGCAGLAANQIGYNLSVLLYWTGGGAPRLNLTKAKEYRFMINPIIDKCFGGEDMMTEGCLSRPGKSPRIKRCKKIKVTYLDEEGNTHKGQMFRGFTARIIQHEIDHLNGIYIP